MLAKITQIADLFKMEVLKYKIVILYFILYILYFEISILSRSTVCVILARHEGFPEDDVLK